MKAKIIIPNVVVVLLLGIGLYGYLAYIQQRDSYVALNAQLQSTATLFARSESLRGYETLQEVTRLSLTSTVMSVFRQLPLTQGQNEGATAYDNRLREAWFKKSLQAVESVTARLEQNRRVPALVFITDRNGVVLARNTTPNACPAGNDVSNAMDVVKRALDGEAGYTVWSVNDSPFNGDDSRSDHVCALMNAGIMETVAVPIWSEDDNVAGTLVVGYEVSNGVASEKAKTLGVEVAIVQDGAVYSTSFKTDADREELNQAIDNGVALNQLKAVFRGKTAAKTFTLTVGGEQYLAFPVSVLNASRGEELAFLFLASLNHNMLWYQVKLPVILFILCSMICLFVVGILLGNHFMKPVIAIEEGVLRIINGDTDYRFDVVSHEVGGLSYRINQLVNVLTEIDDGDEEDDGDDS